MMFRRVAAASRYVIVLAVLSIALLATAIIVYSTVLTVQTIVDTVRHGVAAGSMKTLLFEAIEAVDLFLLGTTLYVIAIGLYELFIDGDVSTPAWLIIRDLDDLKAKVLSVVVVVLGVFFLGQALAWDGARDILPLGAATALVIVALTYFLGQKSRGGDKSG